MTRPSMEAKAADLSAVPTKVLVAELARRNRGPADDVDVADLLTGLTTEEILDFVDNNVVTAEQARRYFKETGVLR